MPDGPNQLRNADIIYVAVASGCIYVALILDARSRRVVGFAIARSIDTPQWIVLLLAFLLLAAIPRVDELG